MKTLVDLFAPRNALDFLFKLAVFLCLIGAANYLRDYLEHGDGRDTFWRNFIEANAVGFPFALLSLTLVAHMRKLQDQLVELATTDLLTGLPNRRAFLTALETLPRGRDAVLLMIDIDHFKAVNDTYGHAVGDLCLQAMAGHLRSCLREAEALARLGGEEFAAVIRPDMPDRLTKVGDCISGGFAFSPGEGATPIRITASVGAVEVGPGTLSTDLLRRADTALYRAKAAGRAQMVVAEGTGALLAEPDCLGPRKRDAR